MKFRVDKMVDVRYYRGVKENYMEENKLAASQQDQDREFWAQEALDLLFSYEVFPLCKEMKENKKHFSFISEREFSTLIKMNHRCLEVDKRVSRQLKAYGRIIEKVKTYEGYVVDAGVQQKLRMSLSTLKKNAIEYGYCKEACELLKMVSNPNLVGEDFASVDIRDDIFAVLKCYGRRAILEWKAEEFKGETDQIITDVASGLYGKKAREEFLKESAKPLEERNPKKLSKDTMEAAYNGATVIQGNIAFKVDGTHEKVSEGKV